MGVNSLPKTVARQRRDCDLNTGPTAPESSTLTTRLPSHPPSMYHSKIEPRAIFVATACGLFRLILIETHEMQYAFGINSCIEVVPVYCHCWRSMQSRVYETVERPSVCLSVRPSVCRIVWHQMRHAAGLSAGGR